MEKKIIVTMPESIHKKLKMKSVRLGRNISDLALEGILLIINKK